MHFDPNQEMTGICRFCQVSGLLPQNVGYRQRGVTSALEAYRFAGPANKKPACEKRVEIS